MPNGADSPPAERHIRGIPHGALRLHPFSGNSRALQEQHLAVFIRQPFIQEFFREVTAMMSKTVYNTNCNTICNPTFVRAVSAAAKPIIDFTRSGWRSFEKVNCALGAHFIRPFMLRAELAEYIAAHEQRGHHFDTDGVDIRYDGGVYVVLRKMQGVWYIVDAYLTDTPVEFKPIYFWQRIQRGVSSLLARLIIGWRVTRTEKLLRLEPKAAR